MLLSLSIEETEVDELRKMLVVAKLRIGFTDPRSLKKLKSGCLFLQQPSIETKFYT